MYLCFVSATLFCLFLQPCGHLQRTGWPLDSIVCCVFVCFCHFPCSPGSGEALDCIDF